ncbi:hypothetical protein F0562_031534 [Nyssa sinensis]|uniref:Uncharacterized protein n=1 Tax=Nyssa sinensis TaxID=561372 RepID=A0A5J5AWW4_9ASTE|nr:hypothetical protein F0562_031534 [Nyssa sinensis]
MKLLGSNMEEQWMNSINLGITNWIAELQGDNHMTLNLKTPSPLVSYAISTFGLWKVQLYCPIIAMDVTKSSNPSPDERLWCDVIRLVTETLMNERGAGTTEKHFPSRISLQLTPTLQSNVLSISVSKSSENPTREIGLERTIEGSFDPPNSIGLKVSAGENVTMSLKPWKFEQSVYGDTANLNWFLHDSEDGREVCSSKPSKIALLLPKTWFKHRYSSVYRPFTRQGGVVFAGDEYGESICWKVDKGAMGKTMEWEIKGWIWLTYWPNKRRTWYTETRKLEFREILHLTLV